jgi:hypothetical protein
MLFLMRRILSTGNPKLQRIITFAMIFMAIDAWIFVSLVIFQCRYRLPPPHFDCEIQC